MKIRVELKNGDFKTSTIDARYELGSIRTQINEVRPESIIQVGNTLLVRADDVKTIVVMDEEVEK